MKHRLERVNEVIRRELSEIVQREVVFTAPLVTVQSADISPNLKTCFIYISVIGTEEQKKEAIVKLLDKRKLLQVMLMKRVVLKYTPQLHFEIDRALERGDRVMQIMDQIVIPPEDTDESDEDNPPDDQE
jgi:ribosome-binding factor A